MRKWTWISIFLAALLAVSAVVYMQNQPAQPTPAPEQSTARAEVTAPEAADTIMVTDMAGRTVEVSKNPQSVCYTWAGVGSFIFAAGAQDKLTAVNRPSDFLRLLYPPLNDIGTVGAGQPDMEALAALNPDVFFHRAAGVDILENVQELGIPSVGVMAESREEIVQMLTLIGQVLGKEEEAKNALAEYNRIYDKAMELTKDIPDEEKKTAVFMGSEVGRVAHGGQLQSTLIEAAGGISCTAEDSDVAVTNEAWATLGVEKIFEWNPDFIFVTNSSANEYSVEELYNDPTWANLKAVQNQHIIAIASDLDTWDFPGVSSALGALWMVQKMYPEMLSEADFQKDVADFYRTVFNFEVTPEILGY